MLVVSRFRVPAREADGLRAQLHEAHALLATKDGYVDGTLGRNLDEPDLWVLATRWDSVGAYRRALSSYDVKLAAVPTLSRAIDEPSAYEVVEPNAVLNVQEPRVT
ncbi:antibiotic biosynthesis monooxygenase family protein [Nocardioides sp. HM23]|uniref:antibiotic biosynthesis monooxygenase family protein n=1 Tax=Nocardioides bizhenqiangii TaxID=3095076 RepID=UPI002AC9F6AA|nr:antibiotic biosynthesis monooxygenase family protein [Nocardioides sp. HM23]MDZ5623271.1 antibiotic biosynthesis monooxygenase family protein [Nocardioides sp. HM23]